MDACPYECSYCSAFARENSELTMLGIPFNGHPLEAIEECWRKHEAKFQGESESERKERIALGRSTALWGWRPAKREGINKSRICAPQNTPIKQPYKKCPEIYYSKFLNLTYEEFNAMHRDQKDQCNFCGEPLNGEGNVDHIQAKSRGGINDISNYQLLCRKCNSAKGAKTQAEYRYYQAVNNWIQGASYGL